MIIAIDTGGTKTLITKFDDAGKNIFVTKFPTPATQQDYYKQLLLALEPLRGEAPAAIAIALPGVIRDNIATLCPSLDWENVNPTPKLQKLFPDTPVFVENDANLAGLGETRQLSTQPRLSLYVTISTGIGTGITLDGQIHPAISHGEGGHMIFDEATWESFGSGKAIYTDYGKLVRDITAPDEWSEIVERMAKGFLALIPTLQPDIIIIGGSVGTYFNRYGDLLAKLLDARLSPLIARPPIVQAVHPEEAVVYGCYYFAIDQLARR